MLPQCQLEGIAKALSIPTLRASLRGVMDNVARTLSSRQMAVGIFVAALIAWLLTVATDIWLPVGEAIFRKNVLGYRGRIPELAQLWGITTLYAVFGIPIALVVSFAVGFPVWRYMDAKGLRSSGDAIRAGAFAGLIISLVSIALSLLLGLATAADDNSSFSSWAYGQQVIDDGLPTTFGWLMKFLSVVTTIVIGAAAGLGAWATVVRLGSHSQE